MFWEFKMSKFNKLVQCKLNEEDYKKYIKKVHKSGYTQSEFFRKCILTNKTEIVDKTISNNLIRQIAWIGNNLNQIAHVLNSQQMNNSIKSETWSMVINELKMIRNDIIAIKELSTINLSKSNVDKI